MKKKKHLFTVLLLAISLLSTNIPVYAQGNGNADNENSTNEESFEEADRNLMKDLLPGDLDLVELSNKELEDYEIPEVISAKDIKEKEHANRLFAQETDDYSIVYQNKDGSKTMYYFDEPVKYTDENGTVCDKSTKLSESDKDGYAFVSADNNINVYMPEQLDNETGIIVKSGEYTIEMSPVDSDKADVSDIITETENKYDEHDIVEYTDVFGVDTTIEYSAQLNGVKENIILDRYNGKNEFSFDVDTNGLVLREEDGYFSIVDDEINEVVGTVSEVILFDSSNGENTIVPQGYVTGYTAVQNDDGRYTITITLDNQWLENEAVYPVVIDPTIKINTSGSGSSKTILDAPVYSKKSTTNFGSYSIGTVGYQDSTYGAGRLVMRFPGLDSNETYKSLKVSEIESVKLYMYEGTGNSGTSTLQVRFSLNNSGWSESSPIYANTNANSKVMSTTTIKKSGVTYKVTTAATYTEGTDKKTTGKVQVTGFDKKAKTLKVADTIKVGTESYAVTSIKAGAFKGASKVTAVTLGKKVKSIGKDTFVNCKKLKTLTIGVKLSSVTKNSFKGCKTVKVKGTAAAANKKLLAKQNKTVKFK